MPKAINVRNNVYALASIDGESAELTMYGDIYEQQPTDWWGDPIEGQFVLLTDFLNDLERLKGCRNLLVRINSYGGDAGASNTIHNRLRELSRDGCKITCVVDGVAMSGGSLIMCGCDTVRVNPSSLIMIHKGWSFLWGGYNADELKEEARMMDAWDKMQAEIYKRKTGLSDTVLLHMMSDTTYMTGREAVEKGFADELIEDAEPLGIAASADGRFLYVRGRSMHLAGGMFAPDFIPTVTPEASAAVETYQNQPEVTGSEGGNSMTIEEIRAQYPDEIAQVEAEARAAADHSEAVSAAVQAERDRLSAIDEVAGLFDPRLVAEAKYGENPCTAAEMALRAAQAAARAGSRFLADAAADNEASGVNAVEAAPHGEETPIETPEAEDPDSRMMKARALIRNVFKKEE